MRFMTNSSLTNKHSISHTMVMIFCLLLIFFSFYAFSKPKTKVYYGYSLEGFARLQVKNETNKELACWVAIDGFKKKFRLPPFAMSRWFTVYDKSYTYENFSVWCDYIELHPEYKNYGVGGEALTG